MIIKSNGLSLIDNRTVHMNLSIGPLMPRIGVRVAACVLQRSHIAKCVTLLCDS